MTLDDSPLDPVSVDAASADAASGPRRIAPWIALLIAVVIQLNRLIAVPDSEG